MANPSLLLLPPQLFLCKHFDRMLCPSPASSPQLPKADNDQNSPLAFSQVVAADENAQDSKLHRRRRLRISHLAMEGLTEWQEGAGNQMDDPEEMRVLFTALDSFM
jgi:hypothetical protein